MQLNACIMSVVAYNVLINSTNRQVNIMYDLVICELCGETFNSTDNSDICPSCIARSSKPVVKRYAASNTTKGYRELAKKFGGKALTGTAKQKEWAEKIRADFIMNTKKDDEFISDCMTAYTDAKTWIENREAFKNS